VVVFTVAIAVLSDVQTTARPESTPPFASRSTSVACVVPTAVIELAASVTLTDDTGAAVTVISALLVLPSLVAMMLAVPAATAVTTPVVAFTVATAELSELQATERPSKIPPPASRVVADACAVSTAAIVLGASATVTVATATGVTVTDELPVCPSLVAVIVAVPGVSVVTSPVELTVATAVLLDAHVTVRPLSTRF
jgi:hypothetical protein